MASSNLFAFRFNLYCYTTARVRGGGGDSSVVGASGSGGLPAVLLGDLSGAGPRGGVQVVVIDHMVGGCTAVLNAADP
jgi:hypothetical protein